MPIEKRSERKLRIRDEARQKVRGNMSGTGSRSYRDAVAQGHKLLLQKSSEGGDGKIKRIRNELTYLLNNYLPSNDNRIEQLIDEWRRSGDPAYDPEIKARYMRVRKDHMRGSNAV